LEPIKLDFAEQATPYLIYERVSTRNSFRAYMNFPLENGYNFFLRKMTARWSEKYPAADAPDFPFASPVFFTQDLQFEFFANGRPGARQSQPIPGQLFTSPCGGDTQSGVMPATFNLALTSSAPMSTKLLNYFYAFRDILQVSITGQTFFGAIGINLPVFVDIVLHGYYVREMSLPENRGA
jgi:hypothetical protein